MSLACGSDCSRDVGDVEHRKVEASLLESILERIFELKCQQHPRGHEQDEPEPCTHHSEKTKVGL